MSRTQQNPEQWVIKRTAEYGKIETADGKPVAMVAREDDLPLIAAAPRMLNILRKIAEADHKPDCILKDSYVPLNECPCYDSPERIAAEFIEEAFGKQP